MISIFWSTVTLDKKANKDISKNVELKRVSDLTSNVSIDLIVQILSKSECILYAYPLQKVFECDRYAKTTKTDVNLTTPRSVCLWPFLSRKVNLSNPWHQIGLYCLIIKLTSPLTLWTLDYVQSHFTTFTFKLLSWSW